MKPKECVDSKICPVTGQSIAALRPQQKDCFGASSVEWVF